MNSKPRTMSARIIFAGWIFNLLGMSLVTEANPVSMTLLISGFLMMLIGAFYYVRIKGRHWAWILLVFLNVVGLLMLRKLEDYNESLNI